MEGCFSDHGSITDANELGGVEVNNYFTFINGLKFGLKGEKSPKRSRNGSALLDGRGWPGGGNATYERRRAKESFVFPSKSDEFGDIFWSCRSSSSYSYRHSDDYFIFW